MAYKKQCLRNYYCALFVRTAIAGFTTIYANCLETRLFMVGYLIKVPKNIQFKGFEKLKENTAPPGIFNVVI